MFNVGDKVRCIRTCKPKWKHYTEPKVGTIGTVITTSYSGFIEVKWPRWTVRWNKCSRGYAWYICAHKLEKEKYND